MRGTHPPLSLSDSERTRYYVLTEDGDGGWYYAEELEAVELMIPPPPFGN